MKSWILAPVFVSLAIGWAQAQTAAKSAVMPLAAHKAVYDLKLVNSAGNKPVTDGRTMIALEFSGTACEGYATNFRQLMELSPAEGQTRQSEMRSVTFEDGEGRNFRFKVNSSVDGDAAEDLDGRAERSGDGSVSVRLDRPQPRKTDLADAAIFPTDHIRHIIAAAKKGETSVAAKVFDGSESGVKLFETLTIIGKGVSTSPDSTLVTVPELANMTRWPVVISYFTVGKSENAPDYVVSFDLYENGVARALKLNYGDFTLAGDLMKIEMLPVVACAK